MSDELINNDDTGWKNKINDVAEQKYKEGYQAGMDTERTIPNAKLLLIEEMEHPVLWNTYAMWYDCI